MLNRVMLRFRGHVNLKSSTTTIKARLRSLARIGPALHPPAAVLVQVEGSEGDQPARRRLSWRSDSACSRIELGTTKAGVSTFG